MGGEDRRRHIRLPKQGRMSCQEITYPMGEAPELAVRMVDVSEGGVRFDAPQPLEVGVLLQVALVLPGWHHHTAGVRERHEAALSRPLTAVGRVAHCRPLGNGQHEVGVEFVDIWDDHWKAMRTYLETEITRQEAQ